MMIILIISFLIGAYVLYECVDTIIEKELSLLKEWMGVIFISYISTVFTVFNILCIASELKQLGG